MRVPRFLGVVVCAAVVCGGGRSLCAQEPEVKPLDPVGVYTFESLVEGQPVKGRITIEGSPGQYTGWVRPEMGPAPFQIVSVSVRGQEMEILGDVEDEVIVISLVFEGDRFSGVWVLGVQGEKVTGERVRAEVPGP